MAVGDLGDTSVVGRGATPTLPAALGTYTDTAYGTTVMRVTDRVLGNDLNTHNYSSDGSSFNCDSTRFVVQHGGSNAGATLYNLDPDAFTATQGDNLQFSKTLVFTFLQWDSTDPDIIYGIQSGTKKLWSLDVTLGSSGYTLLKDFGLESSLDTHFQNLLDAGESATLDYLQKSVDDNIFTCLLGIVNATNNLGVIVAWNRTTDAITVVDLDDLLGVTGIHACLLDKSGEYVWISESSDQGKWVWTISSNTVEYIPDNVNTRPDGHRCMGTRTCHVVDGTNDRLAMVAKDLTSPQGYTLTFKPTLVDTSDWVSGQHNSLHHADETKLLLSHYDTDSTHAAHTKVWQDEIFIAFTNLGETTVTKRFLHHRSEPYDTDYLANTNVPAPKYYGSPRASSSLDGRFCIWASNWEGSNYVDVFIAAIPEVGVKNVYYSVSPYGTSGDLKVAGNITISGGAGVATFSAAQTGNIGIGCHVVSTGVDGYISEMTSSTSAKIVTALGVAHSNVAEEALTSIKHVFASISLAEAGFTGASYINNTSLVAADVLVHLCCYYDHDDQTQDTTALSVTGNTTDATRYVKIYTPAGGTESINSQRSTDGMWDDNKYVMTHATSDIVTLNQDYTVFEGFQIDVTSNNNSRDGITLGAATNTTVQQNIIRKSAGTGTTAYGINGASSGTGTLLINNKIYDFNTTSSAGILGGGGNDGTEAYHNTIYNCITGLQTLSSDVIAKNNAVFLNSNDWNGTFSTSSDYNASDDNDLGFGSNNQALVSTNDYEAEFTDVTTEDVSLVAGGACSGNGVDVSVTTDIAGTTRSTDDIGAFAFSAEGGGTKGTFSKHWWWWMDY